MGQRVAIAAEPGSEFLCILYANILLRTTLAIIDPEMGRDHYRAKLRQFRPEWAFVDSRLLLLQEHPVARWIYFQILKTGPYFPFLKNIKLVATGPWMPIFKKHVRLQNWLKSKKTAPKRPFFPKKTAQKPNDEFLVTYTSGTLAEPKGVLHTLTSLTESIRILGDLLKNNPDEKNAGERMATHLPHYFLIGINTGITSFCWNYKLSAGDKIDFIEKK